MQKGRRSWIDLSVTMERKRGREGNLSRIGPVDTIFCARLLERSNLKLIFIFICNITHLNQIRKYLCFILKGSSHHVYDELHCTDGEFLAWYGNININTNHPQNRQSSDLIMHLTHVWRIMLKILAGIARTSRPVIRSAMQIIHSVRSITLET